MDTKLARRVYERAHLTGEFVLRSGQVSHEYFDKYLLEGDPSLLRDLAAALVPLVPDDADALAGLELGGVPVATALSLATGLPTRFVRKQAKDYGTRLVAEGGAVDGQRLVVVEDVVTTGGQVLASVGDLRSLGATVEVVLCLIDREAGGAGAFAAEDLELRPLFTMSQLEAAARDS